MQAVGGRPRRTNPCRQKGRHNGAQDPGVIYRGKETRIVPMGCECGQNWISREIAYAAGKNYALSSPSLESSHAFLIPLHPKEQKKALEAHPDWTLVLPCKKIFLTPDSSGSKLYKTLCPKAQFKGCQSLEDDAVNEGLIRPRPGEPVGKFSDMLTQLIDRENADEEAASDSPIKRFGVLGISPGSKTRPLSWDGIGPLYTNDEVKDSQGSANDVDPRAPLWLPRLQKNFRKLKLTYRQKSAATLLYLDNPKGLSRSQVAKKLRISPHSLDDRLDQVRHKLDKKFPPSTQEKRAISQASIPRKPKRRASSHKKIEPLYRVNPHSEARKMIPFPIKGSRTPWVGLEEEKELLEKESYWPIHNGIFCAWIPVGKSWAPYPKKLAMHEKRIDEDEINNEETKKNHKERLELFKQAIANRSPALYGKCVEY